MLLVLFLAGCLDIAEDRALRDLEVGTASDGALAITVEDGLAAVLEMNPIRLWAQAPTLAIRIESDAPVDRMLRIENVLPDAELSGATTTDSGTDKAWHLVLPAGTHVLRLAAPDALSREPWRFGLFADVQERIDDVGDIYARMNQDEMRFVVMSGDLTERGTRAQLEEFRERLKELRIPCYATLGNHELGTDDRLFRELYGRGSFSFAFRGVRFTLLDSASATIDPIVFDWLDEWLAAGANQAHVVAMHIPPLDPVGVRNGAFASRNEAARLLGSLANAGVDLTLYGHIHSYYHFENAGIPAHVSGGGGAIPERFDDMGRHFLVVDADPAQQRLDVQVVRVD